MFIILHAKILKINEPAKYTLDYFALIAQYKESLPLLIAILWLRNSRELSNQNDRSQAMTYVMKSFLKLTGF